MPMWVIYLAAATSLGALVAVPILLLVTRRRASILLSLLALLVWAAASLAAAWVWFIVAYASHNVTDELTRSWIVANVGYPLLGAALVLVHRRLQHRPGAKSGA